ncbi:hypothetical protein NM688_g824 [Phlebia brevispora]|uniref:Uncharacterized protein n=1 Tax=Phlebia brevispora TaxID=194682 RepID=A0ACC1TD96_9APHY|nr:hypothetical protein NM688_g824 [Phlebia brevispora]
MPSFYETQLIILVVVCALWLFVDNRLSKRARAVDQSPNFSTDAARSRLMRQYLIVYAIVMGADWLQGPYVYSLYKEQYAFPERLVAVLFVTGFISAGFTAPLTDLSSILGRATLVNGFVATTAGVFSNQLVEVTHSFSSPFVASGALLALGLIVIKGLWAENYGSVDASDENSSSVFQLKRLSQAWNIVRHDPYLLVIGLTQTCFEGSMYLFVFLWVPSLQEASLSESPLPLGYIFSCFMVAMMLGSLLYTTVSSFSNRSNPGTTAHEEPLVLNAKLSSLVCAVSALAFAVTISCKKEEHIRFWAFCAFEACVGMYYPVQGMLRGTLISNEHRATLSSLFRVPLNIFVVVSLLTGVSSARDKVLTASAAMLGISSIMTGVVIVNGLDKRRLTEAAGRPA